MELHLVDATYELFRAHFAPRPPVLGRGGRSAVGRQRPRASSCSTSFARRAPPTSAAPPTGSSARSATTSTPATRPRPGCRRSCWPSSRSPRRPSRPSASSSGRWSSSRRTTPSRAAADRWADDPAVERILICSPDKDIAQCVRDGRVVLLGPAPRHHLRRGRRSARSGASRPARSPTSWPSSATRPTATPACQGWGAKSAAAVLARYGSPRRHPDRALGVGRARRRPRGRRRWRRSSPSGATRRSRYRTLARLRLDADDPPANARGTPLARRRSGGLGGVLRRTRPRSAPSSTPSVADGLRSPAPPPRASGSDARPSPGSVSSRRRTSTTRCAAADRRARDPGSRRGVGRAASGIPRVPPPRPRLRALPLAPP